jgi:hypothetical protein
MISNCGDPTARQQKTWEDSPMKRYVMVVTLLAALCSAVEGQNPDATNPYSMNFVRSELQGHAGSMQFESGYTAKNIYRLGDGVSVALLKILDDSELANLEKIRMILPIIRQAFSHPELINIQVDKDPKVTEFLLKDLQRDISDPTVRSQIGQTLEYVRKQTSTAH